MKAINLKALFAAILFVGVVGGFTVYFAVSTYSTGATLKEKSEVYQYKNYWTTSCKYRAVVKRD